jgi:hypothetical protein
VDKRINSDVVIQTAKMLKLVTLQKVQNDTILYKLDIPYPKEDTLFLDYGIFPNLTDKPYDDSYFIKMKLKPKEIGVDKIDTCVMFGCGGIDSEAFRYGHDIIKEFKISKDINNDLLNICKLLNIGRNELVKDKHATAISLGKRLGSHIEIKGHMCYLEEINKQQEGVNYLELLRMRKKNEANTDSKDKKVKDKIYEIAEMNNKVSMAIYKELLNKLSDVVYDDLKDLKIKMIKDLYK